jgi:hypothetical protein
MRNLAEAAAMGSVSEVVRFLQAGEDPNTLVEVRPFAISSVDPSGHRSRGRRSGIGRPV